jgi:flagellar P-ring protein precursor FlgI
MRVVDAINTYADRAYKMRVAFEKDYRSVGLRLPKGLTLARLFAELGDIYVEPDQPAKIVIDERTGTIVIGSDVRISPIAVAHGNITVKVTDTAMVSQPNPFSNGETVVVPESAVSIEEAGGNAAILKGATLRDLVGALNKMGLKPQGIIAVIQAIKSSGALQAELVFQ